MQTPSQYVNLKTWKNDINYSRSLGHHIPSWKYFQLSEYLYIYVYVVRIFKSCWKHVGQFMLNMPYSWRHLWINKNLWQLPKISCPIHLLILMWIFVQLLFFFWFFFFLQNKLFNKQKKSRKHFHENKFQSYIKYKRNKRTKTEKPQIYLLWKPFLEWKSTKQKNNNLYFISNNKVTIKTIVQLETTFK